VVGHGHPEPYNLYIVIPPNHFPINPARIIHERLQPPRGSFSGMRRHPSSPMRPGIAVVGLPCLPKKSLAGTRCTQLSRSGFRHKPFARSQVHVCRPGVRELSGLPKNASPRLPHRARHLPSPLVTGQGQFLLLLLADRDLETGAPPARGCRSARQTAGSRPFQGMQPLSQRAGPRPAEVVRRLKVQPEFRARSEASREEKSRLRRHAALAANDFIHTLERNTESMGKRQLRGPERSQKLLKKDLTWMRGNAITRQHEASVSVVVRNADTTGVSVFPLEDDPPPVVDPNTAELPQRPLQVLEAVTLRTRRSSVVLAAFSMSSFLTAAPTMSGGNLLALAVRRPS
jgi:hypothetical protein